MEKSMKKSFWESWRRPVFIDHIKIVVEHVVQKNVNIASEWGNS